MGGCGSGNHKYDKRPLVSECNSVWIGQVRAWCKEHGRPLAEIATWGMTATWRSTGRAYTCAIRIVTGPTGRYGGRRYYLACPVCGRRALGLYLPGNAAEGQPYACRRCWRLVYPTQQRRQTRMDRLMASALVGDDGIPDMRAAMRCVDTRRLTAGLFGYSAWADKYRNVFDGGR